MSPSTPRSELAPDLTPPLPPFPLPLPLPTPQVNWFLMALCIIITATFGLKSTVLGEPIELANAYGVAVSAVFLSTTLLITLYMVVVWELTPLLVLLFFLFFGAFDGNILAANLTKVPHGGW